MPNDTRWFTPRTSATVAASFVRITRIVVGRDARLERVVRAGVRNRAAVLRRRVRQRRQGDDRRRGRPGDQRDGLRVRADDGHRTRIGDQRGGGIGIGRRRRQWTRRRCEIVGGADRRRSGRCRPGKRLERTDNRPGRATAPSPRRARTPDPARTRGRRRTPESRPPPASPECYYRVGDSNPESGRPARP